jgi:nucleoside-diphosphate-sugar epimerase
MEQYRPQHGRITMNVFVAGASGAIGRPLVAELVRRGHAVTGMTRSDAGATALANLSRSKNGP